MVTTQLCDENLNWMHSNDDFFRFHAFIVRVTFQRFVLSFRFDVSVIWQNDK